MALYLSPKLVRYGVVGLLTYVFYVAAGQLLLRAEVRLSVLAPVAFTAAVIFNYLLQRAWVFADSRPVRDSLPKYFVMVCVGYVLNSTVLISLAPEMPLSLAQFVAVVAVVISNALFSFLFVFSMKQRSADEQA